MRLGDLVSSCRLIGSYEVSLCFQTMTLEKTLHRAALVEGVGEIFQPGREINESTNKLENVEVTRRSTKLAEGGEGRKGTRSQLGSEVTEM